MTRLRRIPAAIREFVHVLRTDEPSRHANLQHHFDAHAEHVLAKRQAAHEAQMAELFGPLYNDHLPARVAVEHAPLGQPRHLSLVGGA